MEETQSYLIIIVFNLILFFKTLKYGLAVDDNGSWSHTQHAKKWKKESLSGKINRISILLYGAGLFRDNEKDHLFTMVLVTIFSCLLYACFGNIWLSLLWSSHPINNQVTIWLNGRRYLISLVLAMLAYKFMAFGFILYPLSLWFHPISAAVLIAGIIKNPLALTWIIPCILIIPKYKYWISQRWLIQDLKEYKIFNWRKISLAIRCLSEYWKHLVFPTKFAMYHPEIWGIAELEGNRQRNYAFDRVFWLCVLFLFLLGVIGWLGGSSCLLWAIMACFSVIQWSGIWKSPTQLWAQRYASLFSIFGILYILEAIKLVPQWELTIKLMFLLYYITITLKDMGMYRNFYTFFLHHAIMNTHNQNAHYYATVGFNNQAIFFYREKNQLNSLMNDAFSCACGFHWVLHNKTPDLIHDFMGKKLETKRTKVNYEDEK